MASTPPAKRSEACASAHNDRRRGRWAVGDPINAAIITASVLVAAGIDGLQLGRPGFVFGLTADISVYLGGAVRLVDGLLPYRDFVFLQPPGILVLLSPFALVSHLVGTRGALAILRLSTPIVAGTNVLLVGRLVRHRGHLTTLVACGLMALYPAERYALSAGLLEPITDLFCLAGASVIFHQDHLAGGRRMLLGGVLFGIAGAVKGPAIIPVLVVAVMAAPGLRRQLLPFIGGVIAGFGALSLPFVALAPAAFFNDVVVTQLARIPGSGRASIATRLQEMTFGGGKTGAYLTVAVVAVIAISAIAVRLRRLTALEVFGFATLATLGAAQFGTTQYYPQYPAVIAPFIAVVLGMAVGRLASWRASRITSLVAVAMICVLLVSQIVVVEGESTPDVEGSVDAVVPAGACALAARPEILFTANRFVSSVTACTEMVDPFGTMLALTRDPAGGVAAFMTALSRTDYLVLTTGVDAWLVGRYAGLQGYVGAHFHRVRSGSVYIYIRDGFPNGTG